MRLDAKKRIGIYIKNTTATGGGSFQSQLFTADERTASIIGETSLSGIIPDGDSNMPQLESTAISDGKVISKHIH